MATLKLNKKPASAKRATSGDRSAAPEGERRAPLRGKGVSRPRQTLAQAQAERAERQAAFESRQKDRAPEGGQGRPAAEPKRARPPAGAGRFRAEGPAGSDTRAARSDERTTRAKPQGERARRDGEEPRRQARDMRDTRDGRDRRDGRDGRDGRDQRGPARSEGPADSRAGGRRAAPSTAGDGPPPARKDQRRATALRSPGLDKPLPDPARRAAPQPRSAAAAEGERLSKRMSEQGLASRREADEWIAAGWVRVDGKMAELGQRVGPDARIEIDPAARQAQARAVTILLHKPIGYVSGQAEDGYEPASVLVKPDTHWREDSAGIDWHPGHGRRLAPAGRLDIDSTGLLVLTQDGRIAKALIGEESLIEKEYLVRVAYVGTAPDGKLPAEDMARLQFGLELDGVQLKPAKVSWANEDQLRFVLREGRKRQVRRMCELVGLKVLALKRVRIGQVVLGKLPAGQWRYLAPWERF